MKSLKALLSIAIFGAVIYVAFRLVPIYMSNYQFQDAIEEEARLDAYSQKTEEDIKSTVLKKAQSLDIPIDATQLKVQKNGGAVWISAAYIVHVDFPIHPVDLSFTPTTQSTRIY